MGLGPIGPLQGANDGPRSRDAMVGPVCRPVVGVRGKAWRTSSGSTWGRRSRARPCPAPRATLESRRSSRWAAGGRRPLGDLPRDGRRRRRRRGRRAPGLTEPDRVVREFKRRIGDPTPVIVGGRPWAAAGPVGAPRPLGGRPGRRARGRARRPDRGHPPRLLGAAQEGAAGRRARGAGPARVDVPRRAAGGRAALRLERAGGARRSRSPSTTSAAARSTPRSCAGRHRLRAARPAGGHRAARRHRLRRRSCSSTSLEGMPDAFDELDDTDPGGAVRRRAHPARVHRGQGGAQQRHRGVDPGAAARGPVDRCGCTAASSRR